MNDNYTLCAIIAIFIAAGVYLMTHGFTVIGGIIIGVVTIGVFS